MSTKRPDRRSAILLTALLLLFVGRVLAQLSQVVWPNDIVPPFSEWQSGLLPYPFLVASQAGIIAVSLWLIVDVAQGALRAHPKLGALLLTAGIIYFGFMAFRLVAGLTFLKGSPFFGGILPAGAYAPLLLVRDAVSPSLRFGRGGIAQERSFKGAPGFGLAPSAAFEAAMSAS